MPVFKKLTLLRKSKNAAGTPTYTELAAMGASRLEAGREWQGGQDVAGYDSVTAWRTTAAAASRPESSRPDAFEVDGQRYRLARREVDGNAVIFYGG